MDSSILGHHERFEFFRLTIGHDECAKVLVEAGANIDAKSGSGRRYFEL
jgi:hypothetical protein